MKKWKVGNYFFNTINSFVDGSRTIKPNRRVFICVDIKDEKYNYSSDKTIYLKDVDSGQIEKIGDDDRYGYYPLVDAEKIQNIRARIVEAEANLETLKYLENMIRTHVGL